MDENQGSAIAEQQKSTGPMIVVGIVVVIAIIAGVFWLTGNQNVQPAQTTQTAEESEQATVTETPSETATEGTEDSMAKTITVEGGNFFFKPDEIRVKQGEKVTITFSNSGGMHNFVIDEFSVESETINGGTTTVEFTPDKAGTFEFYCSIGNHRQMGMKGTLIVE